MSFSLLFLMLATEKMKMYLYVSTHFRSCGTIHEALEVKGQHGSSNSGLMLKNHLQAFNLVTYH